MTRPARDRNRAGERRVSGEPLAAKWRPTDDPPSVRRRPVRRNNKGVLATYGWRVYAIPVLVAVTVLVVIQTAGDDGSGAAAAGPGTLAEQNSVDGDVYTSGPQITEKSVQPNDPNIPTAELPAGPDYLQTGSGKFTLMPGTTGRVGNGGKLYTYTVEIEEGIDLNPYGGLDSFGRLVDSTLADPRGWAGTGQVSVQRVDGDANPDIRFTLGTPDTLHRPDYCGQSIKYESSCWRRSEKRVMINLARWVRGALAFGGDIGSYREYAINHEIGHAFGKGHVGCGEQNGLAPVMMQQSFGTANDYVALLNSQANNRDPVQANGLTCRFNQWPNPQAQPAS